MPARRRIVRPDDGGNQGTAGPQSGNPLDSLPDIAEQSGNPLDALADVPAGLASLSTAERRRHADILRRNEEARAREHGAEQPHTITDQIAEGAREVGEAILSPWQTVKGLAKSAGDDLLTTGALMDVAESQGTDHPRELTPELIEKGPRAVLNTGANLILPAAGASGLGMRTAINATLGAANDPEQPFRGATAGLVLGEALHQAPRILPGRRSARPEIRLDQASDPLQNAAFADRLEEGRADAVPGRETVDRIAGYQPTAQPSRPVKLNPRNPEGFQPGAANPLDGLPDATGKKLAPLATDTPAAELERMAKEAEAARADRVAAINRAQSRAEDATRAYHAAQDAAEEELTRQAALRALTGVRRRPGGVKPEGPAPEGPGISFRGLLPPDVNAGASPSAATPPLRDLIVAAAIRAQEQRAGLSEAPRSALDAINAPEPVRNQPGTAPEPLPEFPEGFAMGDKEGRVPKVPRQAVPEAKPGGVVDALLEGVNPDTIAAAKALKGNRYRAHSLDQLTEAALDAQEQLERAQQGVMDSSTAELNRWEKDFESVPEDVFYEDRGREADFTPSATSEKALARAKSNLAQIERAFALRGVAGDELAERIAAARDARIERQGIASDETLNMLTGADSFDPFGESSSAPAAEAGSVEPPMSAEPSLLDAPLPEGTPKRGPLLNPAGFAEGLRPALAEAERDLAQQGVTKRRVTLDEQRAQAAPLRMQLAADLGMSVLDLDPRKVGRMTGAEIVAVREQAGQFMDQITAMTKQLADPSLGAADREALAGMIENARNMRDGLLDQVVTGISQKGRDLSFLRQVAQRTLDPDVWMVHLKKNLGDRPLTDDMVANLTRLVREAQEACG